MKKVIINVASLMGLLANASVAQGVFDKSTTTLNLGVGLLGYVNYWGAGYLSTPYINAALDFSILEKQKLNSGPFNNWSLIANKYKRGGGDFKTYGQLGLFTSSNFKGTPGIGPILSLEKGENFAFGANVGFLYYFTKDITAFRMPVNGFVRYYFSDGEGFFPEATLGLDYYHSKTNGIISISLNSTNLALSFGPGFKSGNFIVGASYYMIMSQISGNAFLFKVGFAF